MDFQTFFDSVKEGRMPSGLSTVLQALWHDGRDDWDRAHTIAQDIPGKKGALVHAYLHRKEGDHWNAGYWYRSAGTQMPEKSLREEWEELVQKFLKEQGPGYY